MDIDISTVVVCSLKKYEPCYRVVYISNVNTATNLVGNSHLHFPHVLNDCKIKLNKYIHVGSHGLLWTFVMDFSTKSSNSLQRDIFRCIVDSHYFASLLKSHTILLGTATADSGVDICHINAVN